MGHYNSYRSYLRQRFGGLVLKVPLNGGFSCPNRDGSKSANGCTFCDNRAFSPVADVNPQSAAEQLRHIIEHQASRYSLFLPYLQPFSNTYGTVDQLSSVYEPLIGQPGVIGLAVGTRPDCFNQSVYDYLEDVSKRTYLVIEIGVQTSHESTLKRLNRGHTYDDFVSAVRALSQRGIYTVAHVMLGLPGEDKVMMIETARRLAVLPVGGVKIHQLMIIKGTEIESQFTAGDITALSLDEYVKLLADFIGWLRPDQHIHRLMADSRPEHGLVAPLWSAEKTKSIKFLQNYFMEKKVHQGINSV